MKLIDIYRTFVQEGIKADFRSPIEIKKKLSETRKNFRKLSSIRKRLFDKESLTNPFSDTRILHGDVRTHIKRVLVGIDMEVGEVLLADRISKDGRNIDLILAHHPEGVALAGLYDVMDLQTDVLRHLGFKAEIARSLMDKRIHEVNRRLHSANHARAVDAAKLLNIPMMCCHTPADNHVAGHLQKIMDAKKPKTLQSIIDLLLKEPEYQDGERHKAGPKILIGKSHDKAGRVFVDMTGGTEGSKEIFARLSQLGIDTLLCMHLSEEHYNRVKSEHIHVVNAGHTASDNLGMNLLLDKLLKKDFIEFIECSGFRRVRR